MGKPTLSANRAYLTALRRMTPEQRRAWEERARSNAAGPHADRRLRRTSRRSERERSIRESKGE